MRHNEIIRRVLSPTANNKLPAETYPEQVGCQWMRSVQEISLQSGILPETFQSQHHRIQDEHVV